MHPEVFGISTYGLMAGLGVIAAIALLIVRNRTYMYGTGQLVWICVATFTGMIVGSKIVFMISRIPAMIEEGQGIGFLMDELFMGGYVFYGGVLGAYAGLFFLSRAQYMPYVRAASYVTPAFCLFHMFGRIGCLLGGCCYGIETQSFGVWIDGVMRFPVQLIEAVIEGILVIVLIMLENRAMRQRRESVPLATIYMLVYSIARFILEFFRGDEIRGFFGPLSTSQWIAFMVCAAVLIRAVKYKKK